MAAQPGSEQNDLQVAGDCMLDRAASTEKFIVPVPEYLIQFLYETENPPEHSLAKTLTNIRIFILGT